MLSRRKVAPEALNVSALDLFASALGIFILIAILMFPYYLRQPSIEAGLAGAKAELAAAEEALIAHEEDLAAASQAREETERGLADARQRLAQLQSLASASSADLERNKQSADAAARELGALGRKMTSIAIADLDLVFVMDTTGSMGDELKDIQANLQGVIRVLHRLAPSLQVGFVAFKDRTDAYVTRVFALENMTKANLERILRFVSTLDARGGGDAPEPVDQALSAALAMPWRSNAAGRIIIIGDAPPHAPNWQRTLDMAAGFRNSAGLDALPRSVSTIFTGSNPQPGAFFKRLAAAGGGDFTAHRGQMIESVLLSVLQ